MDDRRHRGQSVDAASAPQAQQQRLGLVVPVMSDEEMQDAAASAPRAHQPVSRRARARLKVGASDAAVTLVPSPRQPRVGNSARAEPSADGARLRRRFGSKAMIHRQGCDRPATGPRPAIRQQRQRQTVRAARHRDGKPRLRLERPERVEGLGERPRADGLCTDGAMRLGSDVDL